MNYKVSNVLDLIDEIGEEETRRIASTYRCGLNVSVERFVRGSAVDFAKQGISITYFVFASEGDNLCLAGIFTLANKILRVGSGGVSRTTAKRLAKFSEWDPTSNSYMLSSPLIAQLGKNDDTPEGLSISGHELMRYALSTLRPVFHTVGGRAVYLECEDVPKLREFYENEKFIHVSERYSNAPADDGCLYHVYVSFPTYPTAA